ncbi:ABC transporter permease [Alishewanella tabrizica]|uniref:Transport permease protein n=1 Tax=Alishewanella tabrizica TaxID=671278 RepID=A0ABQ2WBU7_9ALTE|nr:ABC transporter permease [Alishewanella tabrizica]GGW48527.1 transport permease protein [Alishewanella tabrizica]
MHSARSPYKVTLHVWHALFMREASARITGDRLGWTWIFIEPLVHILLFVAIRQLMGRVRHIAGAEFIPWFITGMVIYLMFSTVMNRSMGAISASRALFAYRQVHPVDTIVVRAILEVLIKVIVLLLLVGGAAFLEYDILPANALAAASVWCTMWIFALGVGLVFSVIVTTIQEMAKFIGMVTFPLYFLSGVMIPVQVLPHSLQTVLLFNPILHIVESFRLAFFTNYQSIYGINMQYVMFWTLSLVVFGLMLQIRFKNRLMSE